MTDPRGGQTRVTMYRTRSCPFCVAAERLLREREVDFEQVYLDEHPDRRRITAEIKPGHFTVPLVVIDGRPVGGFQELQSLDAAGGLDRLSG